MDTRTRKMLRSRAQPTAFFTSAPIFASSAAVNSFSAKEAGHMAPSSRFASSLKPSVAYLELNFSRALEEADDLAVPGVRGHPVPGLRREGRRAGLDDRMEPLGHGAIRFRHLGDLREHGALPVRLVLARARFRLQLLGALLHRGPFLVRESLGLLCAHRYLLCGLSRVLLRRVRGVYSRPRTLTSRFLIGSITRFVTHDEALWRQPRASGTGSMRDRGHADF